VGTEVGVLVSRSNRGWHVYMFFVQFRDNQRKKSEGNKKHALGNWKLSVRAGVPCAHCLQGTQANYTFKAHHNINSPCNFQFDNIIEKLITCECGFLQINCSNQVVENLYIACDTAINLAIINP